MGHRRVNKNPKNSEVDRHEIGVIDHVKNHPIIVIIAAVVIGGTAVFQFINEGAETLKWFKGSKPEFLEADQFHPSKEDKARNETVKNSTSSKVSQPDDPRKLSETNALTKKLSLPDSSEPPVTVLESHAPFIESGDAFRPEKILDNLRDAKPMARGKVLRAYSESEVRWNLEISEVYSGGFFSSDTWIVGFTSPGLFPTRKVKASVPKGRFPELDTMKKGTSVHVSGTVLSVGPIGEYDTLEIHCDSIIPF